MILLVQLNDDTSVDLLFDQDGLNYLKEILNKEWKDPIKNENNLYNFDHEHLLSKEWGGYELTPEFTTENTEKIHSLKIVYLGTKGELLLQE